MLYKHLVTKVNRKVNKIVSNNFCNVEKCMFDKTCYEYSGHYFIHLKVPLTPKIFLKHL